MSPERVCKLPPRYRFLLNPHTGVRLSKCPRCNRLTHPRKFALLIHVERWGPLVLGKTCRYCTPCELIIAHCNELEAELERSPAHMVPGEPETGYLVLGTVDRKEWQKGRHGRGRPINEILSHTAVFIEKLELQVGLRFDQT